LIIHEDQAREEWLEKEKAEWKAEIVNALGFDPSVTRVLELKDNPSSRLYADLKERDRFEELQNHQSIAEFQSLQREVESKEKTIIRLKQVFQSKIQEYRSFVTNLLGYNVEMDMDGKSCTLKPVYHQEGRDPVFYYWIDGEDTNVKVMGGNRITTEIQHLLQNYVSKEGNYPGFFANVLLLLRK
jgi:predicted aminopeptidase